MEENVQEEVDLNQEESIVLSDSDELLKGDKPESEYDVSNIETQLERTIIVERSSSDDEELDLQTEEENETNDIVLRLKRQQVRITRIQNFRRGFLNWNKIIA